MQNEILRGEDLDAKNSLGYTLLHKAASGQQLERVKSLVKQGATVDVQDKHGITPLSYAVMFNDQEIVKFLIEEGRADIESGMTYRPLFYAIARGHKELAEYLINKGADVNYLDITGETLIHKAARSGNLDMVKFLVEKAHANINVLDKYKETPLHAAVNGEVNSRHIEVAKYLIGNGADINLTHNYTPLHLAILRDNLDMVKCLVEQGASLHIKRGCDGTPLAFAKQLGRTEIAKYIDSIDSKSSPFHSNTISHDGVDVNINHNLAHDKFDVIKNSISNAVSDFKQTFDTSDHERKINVYIFNNRGDYERYLEKTGVEIGGGVIGYTAPTNLNAGNGADVYVYLDHKGNVDQNTLEHEIAHAMQLTNLGLSYVLPKAMHEGIANYIARLENGTHVNDSGDIKALSVIKVKDLKPGAILSDDNSGQYYYSEAEQVIKFLEDKHSDMLDKLLKALSQHKESRSHGGELIENFMKELKGCDSEFKGWVEEQIKNHQDTMSNSLHDQHARPTLSNELQGHQNIMSNSLHDQHAQSAQPTQSNELQGHQNTMSNSLHDQHAQSAQPTQSNELQGHQNTMSNSLHYVNEKREVKQQEPVILKDTIVKIEKSHDEYSQGKHKANVVIDYYDMRALYEEAKGSEKQPVLEFWNKLHVSEYKLGALPEEKYYFMEDKFFIHDDQEKKYIVLPKDKISIKVMKLGDDYKLVIANEKGDVINSISKVENLNYGLLLDPGSFNIVETKNSIELADQHSEYDLYLINGLGGEMFNCTDNYNSHDHSLV